MDLTITHCLQKGAESHAPNNPWIADVWMIMSGIDLVAALLVGLFYLVFLCGSFTIREWPPVMRAVKKRCLTRLSGRLDCLKLPCGHSYRTAVQGDSYLRLVISFCPTSMMTKWNCKKCVIKSGRHSTWSIVDCWKREDLGGVWCRESVSFPG